MRSSTTAAVSAVPVPSDPLAEIPEPTEEEYMNPAGREEDEDLLSSGLYDDAPDDDELEEEQEAEGA